MPTGLIFLSTKEKSNIACRVKYKSIKNAVPIILKDKCIAATRLAFLLTPILESNAVAHVPIFYPIIIGMAIPYVIPPAIDNA